MRIFSTRALTLSLFITTVAFGPRAGADPKPGGDSTSAAASPDDLAQSEPKEIPGQDTAADTCTVIAFGYSGTDICGTAISCDWNGDAINDESFVIAPDRTIWHAWPHSGGWKQMPNSGRADDTNNCYIGGGHRVIEVRAGSDIWYSWLDLASGVWHGWFKSS